MKSRPFKIGILTFHEIFNPGAFLQAYATQQLLRRMGHSPEIIDYTPEAHRYSAVSDLGRYKWRLPLRWRSWLDALIRDRAFRQTRRDHMLLSPRFRTREEIGREHYDAVLVGADIVWNFKMRRLGEDPVYFGEGLNTDRLIAFAPSCGECSVNDKLPEYASRGLMRFSALSARDQNTADIVEKSCGVRPTVICDPTFHLLDTMQVKSPRRADFILIYVMAPYASKTLVDQVKELRTKTKLPVRALLYRNRWADVNVMNCNPFAWVEAIQNARHVITNTFHGTIFSMLTRSDFIVELNPAIRNKTEGLLDASGLAIRSFGGDKDIESLLNEEIDFDRSVAYVQKEAGRSLAYLEKALS